MHIAEVVTIAKSLPLLRLNTYKSLILSYSADYRRIFMKKTVYFILLSAATFLISCASNTTGIDAYTETLYKPSYASGFEIVGAEGRQSTLLKVFNPWQGAENTETTLFIVRNGE